MMSMGRRQYVFAYVLIVPTDFRIHWHARHSVTASRDVWPWSKVLSGPGIFHGGCQKCKSHKHPPLWSVVCRCRLSDHTKPPFQWFALTLAQLYLWNIYIYIYTGPASYCFGATRPTCWKVHAQISIAIRVIFLFTLRLAKLYELFFHSCWN